VNGQLTHRRHVPGDSTSLLLLLLLLAVLGASLLPRPRLRLHDTLANYLLLFG